jgi:hypothetical protein
MAGKPTRPTVKAMRLLLANMKPYAAAKRAVIAPATMYRSRLYKMWQRGELAELKKELTELEAYYKGS